MRTIEVDDPDAIDVTAAALAGGGVVVLPTDTVYGLAALPDAVDRLYELKDRPASVPIAVLVASIEQAADLGDLSGPARRLVDAFWPGPLTVVLERRDGTGTVGVRCPDDRFVRELATRLGPLTTTSANRHGEPTPSTAAEAAGALAGSVDVVVDGGERLGTASTVVDGTAPEVPVLREGPISQDQVRAVALP